MATQILMPALSPTMEEGTLAKWLVKEGDAVNSGDIIAEIETDKATMEFEAVDEGTLGKILIPEGTEGREGQHADRRAARGGRGRLRAAAVRRRRRGRARRSPSPSEAPAAAAAVAAGAARRAGARARGARGHRVEDQTVREALRDAMAEEMRRDETSS